MKKENKYTDAPEEVHESLLSYRITEDFLPPPEQLVAKEETAKITIALSKKSLDFFRKTAKQNHVPYQQMIRKVLDSYTEHYAK